MSLTSRWTHYCFLCFYFSCWLYSLSKMKSTFIWKKTNNCSSFKINTTSWVLHLTRMSDVSFFFLVVYFSYRPWYVLLFFLWKEWQVQDGVTVLGHFQHCSVICLSCLDELLNNDILLSLSFAWYVLAKRVQYFDGTFWLMKVDVLFLSFFARNDDISFGWDFVKRGVEEKS